jgi:tetratricopeptide (TPR) repeat protein
MLTAATTGVAGLYMTWIRGSIGDLPQHIGSSLSAILIWLCAAMALRYAMARDFTSHRRWALRLFLVVSAAWFYRLVFFLMLLIFQRPVGFDPTTFTGPFPTFMSFGQYLVPLGIVEIYFRAQARRGALGRMATAALLFVITIAMGAGIFAVTMAVWLPQVKAGFDSRTSIAETLSATMKSSGLDQAVRQYHEIKTTQPATYNFDEGELNTLGYQLIRKKKFKEAVRIFQLNVEAYPHSSNAYDSLAEGYMDDGDRVQAIANYEKALQLNPKNSNSAVMMKKLTAH